MIRVIKNWVIDSYAYGFVYGKTKTNKKGKEIIWEQKYTLTIKQALQAILNAEQAELITRNNFCLKEAIEKLEALQKEFEKAITHLK